MYLAYIYLVIKDAGRLLITRCNLLRIRSQKLKAQRGELFVLDIGKVTALK